jgi:MFS family permease
VTSPIGGRVAGHTGLPRLALAGIFGGLFCGYLSLAAVIPVLPLFIRDRYGATNLLVGLVVTGTALSAVLGRPIAGMLADRYGHRRVMQAGALIVAAGGLAYLMPIGLGGLVVVRLLLGAGEASLFTAGAVWVLSLTPRERRGQLIGLYGVSMWGGISAGTFVGASLQHVGYAAVWTFSLVVPLVGLALVSLVPAPPPAARATGGQRLLIRPAVLPGVALGLAAGGYAGLAAFVVLHLQARGIHAGVVVLGCFSAVYAGTRLVIGHLPDRLGPRRVATWCGVGEAAGLLIIAAAPNLVIAIIGSVVMGVGFSLLHPSLALMVMNRTAGAQQGAAIGAYTSFWDLGVGLWGPLAGVIASGLGYPAVFIAGAAGAATAAVMARWIGRPQPEPAPATAPAAAAAG